MERASKLLLTLTVALMVFASKGEGARTLKNADQPQNFFRGIGRSFPSPGFTGSFPSPGFSGSFPSPGFSFGPLGAGTWCSFFPGSVGCVPAPPKSP
ncbi:Neuromodulin like [Actinidia chinensis var. chinensis]|uniref:Neuromodulin like n=1 Tax=Actinidia chinensis var. chinensis TaxID=1590841 RepID=A0A2R6Q752_ACTCC|nr:Neuromodulin like [Actinidia chinensis var. chinensis]